MKRWLPLLLVVVAVVAALLEPTKTVIGRIRGEAFVEGRSASFWHDRLAGDDPAAREKAVETLLKGGAASAPVLQQILARAQVPEVRWTAIELLSKQGGQARAAVPDVIRALGDSDPHVQTVAATALPEIETPASEAVPALAKLLDSNPSVPVERALSKYGADASPTLDRLVAILRDRSLDTEVRWNAARTLGKMREAGAPAIPALLETMHDEAPTIREHAAEALGDIGPPARHTVPELCKLLTDSYVKVRRDAVRSIGQTGVEPGELPTVMAAIEPLLKDPEAIVREAAAKTLETLKSAQ